MSIDCAIDGESYDAEEARFILSKDIVVLKTYTKKQLEENI